MAPAMSRPITRSRRMAAHSITNPCDTDVEPLAGQPVGSSSEPRARTDMYHGRVPLHGSGQPAFLD